MRSWTDNQGRSWHVEINVEVLRRVRGLTGLNLMELVSGDLADRLAADPVLLGDLVYAVCQPQAEAAGIDSAEFGRGLAGDAVDAASKALLEAVVDFFPSRRRRVLQQALEKLDDVEQELIELAERRLSDPQTRQRLVESFSSTG